MSLKLTLIPFLSLILLFPALANAFGCTRSEWSYDYYFKFVDSRGKSFTPYYNDEAECKADYEKAQKATGPLKMCGCKTAVNKTVAIISGDIVMKAMLYCYDIDSKGVGTEKFLDSWGWGGNFRKCEEAKKNALANTGIVRTK